MKTLYVELPRARATLPGRAKQKAKILLLVGDKRIAKLSVKVISIIKTKFPRIEQSEVR